MLNPLISIILPVFNVEKYLRQSLDSIVSQDLTNCEVLLINDGSTDDSLDILNEYAQKYSRLQVIDKKNEGVSVTRNFGLDFAKGEYFIFMDADDLLHPHFLDLVTKEIEKSKADVITWNFTTFYSHPRFAKVTNELAITMVDNSHKGAFNYLMRQGSAVSLWNKAIRRSLVANEIRIDPSMTYGEDMFFSWKVLLLAKSIRYIKKPLYYYRQTNSGATTKFHDCLYEHYRKAFDDMKDFIITHHMESKCLYNDLDYHFACRIPSLTKMEVKAPYPKKKQENHLNLVLRDDYIQRGLLNNANLDSKIFQLARQRKVSMMLNMMRFEELKVRLLYPLKKILK